MNLMPLQWGERKKQDYFMNEFRTSHNVEPLGQGDPEAANPKWLNDTSKTLLAILTRLEQESPDYFMSNPYLIKARELLSADDPNVLKLTRGEDAFDALRHILKENQTIPPDVEVSPNELAAFTYQAIEALYQQEQPEQITQTSDNVHAFPVYKTTPDSTLEQEQ